MLLAGECLSPYSLSKCLVLTLQGIQYAATAYTQMLRAVDAELSMAEIGEAWQNGYAERLIRTKKEEEACRCTSATMTLCSSWAGS
jgi:transposase InsO family protein